MRRPPAGHAVEEAVRGGCPPACGAVLEAARRHGAIEEERSRGWEERSR